MLKLSAAAVVTLITAVFSAGQVQGMAVRGVFLTDLTSQFEISCISLPDDYYPDPHSCDHYYICDSQIAYKVQCDSGFLYNAVTKHCDWAAKVNCHSTCSGGAQSTTPFQTTTQSTPPQTTSQERSLQRFCSAKADGVYRDPTDCSKYTECSGGRGQSYSCSPGLVFNELVLACQQPYLASGCAA